MAGKRGTSGTVVPSKSPYLSELESAVGSGQSFDPGELDSSLWWMATVACTRRGAAIQLGTTRARNGWVLTIYDGDYPFKQYPEGTEHLHTILVRIVRAYMKSDLPPEWSRLLEGYGV